MDQLSPLDSTWLLFSAFLVMTMQIGFCMLEAGLVRQKNGINVAFKNLTDFVVSAIVFWAIGFGVMFGASVGGWFGSSAFFVSHDLGIAAFFLFQMTFCSAAATIVGGALAERTRFGGYIAISVLMAAVIYPVAGHWVWGGVLSGEASGWLGKLGFIDFAGSTVVHSVGGWMALAAALIVGPRIGRFGGESTKLRGSNYPVATVGVFLLWFGWFGFNGGSTLGYDTSIGPVLVNTSLSAAMGCMTMVLFAYTRNKQPDIGACLNGTIAGLVAVTAGAHLFDASDAVLVGILGALTCHGATQLLAKYQVDDVVGAFPAHACAGIVGTLLVAILGDPSGFANGYGPLAQLGVQAVGVLAIALWAFGVGYAALLGINKLSPLRVSAEAEEVGLNVAEHNASTDLAELLDEMGAQRRTGDFSNRVTVEQYSDVSLVANEYNRVLSRVEEEITQREDAFERLKAASHFQFIFEHTSEGIVQFAVDGSIMQANPAAADILGYLSPEELIERTGYWLSSHAWSDRSKHEEAITRLTHRGLVQDVELEFDRFIDDRRGYLKLSVRRIRAAENNDGSQRDASYLASIVDMSEQRANARLMAEKNAAEEANKAKSAFLANMSHEIRTPLNGVTGMLELLKRTELDQRQGRYVQIADASARSLLSVINDILDVSKIEAGKLELETVEFNLPELLADVVDMFAPQASTRGLELINMLDPGLPARVKGDPERLRQILVNLLGNALKFTESGTVTLICRDTAATGELSDLEFIVKDTGCGIAKKDAKRLFEPFTQADDSTTRKYGGTGLGLSITRRLVELMHGDISVDSELGKGTSFIIKLKLPIGHTQGVDFPTVLSPELKGLRVLAVDDHLVNLELLEDLLGPQDLLVDRALNGRAALELLEKAHNSGNQYDLVLLDFHMPGMDGHALARRIRANPDYQSIKLMLLTSIDQAIQAQDQHALDIAGVIVKPLRASRLFDALNEILAGSTPGAHKPSTGDADVRHIDVSTKTTSRHELPPAAPQNTPASVPLQQVLTDAQGSSASATPAGASPPADATAESTALSGLTVLVAEDNPVNQIVTEELVSSLGATVEIVEDGKQAIARLAEGGVDMVLMDCAMPVMDGFAATRVWRKIEQDRKLARMPIIAVTANAIVGDRERCLKAGMDDYVTKPISPAALEAAMSDIATSEGFKRAS